MRPKALLMWALVAMASISPALAIGPSRRDRGPLFTTSTMVHSLDVDSYDAMLNDTKTVWVVDFYSPWCPHCRQFAPEWEKVANIYAPVDAIQLGAVDCTKQNEVCDREDVQSYPRVKLYHAAVDTIEMPHDGYEYARDVAKWLEEILKENDMQPGVDIDKIYPPRNKEEPLKKEFTGMFGNPMEPTHDDRSVEIQLKRLKDAGTTALFILEDGFFMGTTMLEGERYEAAVTWVKTLAATFPMRENREAFTQLEDEMKQQSKWKLAEWKQLLTKWKSTANVMSYPVSLFANKDDLALCTTFTCGLWTLFHSLTVSDVKEESFLKQRKPSETMAAIRLVVKYFFGCEECKQHFLKANPESIIKKMAGRDDDGPHAVALWIWTMHNTVNRVLGKSIWPTKLSCPNCYVANDPMSLHPAQLNTNDIIAYVRGVYKVEDKLKLEQRAGNGSKSWLSISDFTSIGAVAFVIAMFITLFQQHKHRFFDVKAFKGRDHIA